MRFRIPGNCLLTLIRLVCLLATATCVAAETNRSPQTLQTYLKNLGYCPIQLQRRGEVSPSVEVIIGDRRHRFVVDTGCTITTVDKAIGKGWSSLKNLNVVLEDSFFGVWTNSGIVPIPAMRIGDAWFTNQPACIRRFSAAVAGKKGMLGVDFMLRNHSLFDCSGPQLFVRQSELPAANRAHLERTMEVSGFKKVRLQRCRGLGLTCVARLNAQAVTLFIDSGAFWTVLDERVASRCKLNVSETGAEIRGVAGQRENFQVAPLKSLELDGVPVSTRTKEIGVARLGSWKINPTGETSDSRMVDGLLGGELLMLCQALVDPAGNCMWVVPDESREK